MPTVLESVVEPQLAWVVVFDIRVDAETSELCLYR